MPSFVPERPTLPPLRSLALPMHGVPSKMTLPGIPVSPLTRSSTATVINTVTGSLLRPLIPNSATQMAGTRLLSHIFTRAVSPASSVYSRSPRIYVLQFGSQLPTSYASDESRRTTRSPRPDRLARKGRCRARHMLDKCIECVGCTQDDLLPRCTEQY
jgi:hypothetical protein